VVFGRTTEDEGRQPGAIDNKYEPIVTMNPSIKAGNGQEVAKEDRRPVQRE